MSEIELTPQQTATALKLRARQACLDFPGAETAASARELADLLIAYADAVEAAAAKPRRRRRVPSSTERLNMARTGRYADGVKPGDL